MISENFGVYCQMRADGVALSPLYLLEVRLIAPRKLLDAQLFCKKYRNYRDITFIPDKLRWCRYSRGMTQEEVAHQVDLSKQSYARLETSWNETPSIDTLKKVSYFYELPLEDLLDDYATFRYLGQAQQAKAHRAQLGLSVSEFATLHNVSQSNIYAWEKGIKVISRRMWARCYKIVSD